MDLQNAFLPTQHLKSELSMLSLRGDSPSLQSSPGIPDNKEVFLDMKGGPILEVPGLHIGS